MSIHQLTKSLFKDRKGAAAAEYALILAIVAAGIAVAAFDLGTAIDGSIGNAETVVSNCAVNATGTGTVGTCGVAASP